MKNEKVKNCMRHEKSKGYREFFATSPFSQFFIS
jgi:hypothetical protein